MQQPLQKQARSTIDGLGDFFVNQCHDDASVTPDTDMVNVSVPEAAKLLGITERSVWRRIRAQKLQAKQHQGKTIVSVRQSDVRTDCPDEHDSQSVLIIDGQTDTSGHQLAKLFELLREKDRQLQAASFRNGYLEAQLAVKEEQLKLLPDFEAKAREGEELKAKFASLEAMHKRRWWRRFMSWLMGQSD